jgi:hypothetical protein
MLASLRSLLDRIRDFYFPNIEEVELSRGTGSLRLTIKLSRLLLTVLLLYHFEAVVGF